MTPAAAPAPLRLEDFIRPFEGLHDGDKRTPLLEPQQDFIGKWTLGYGSIYDADDKLVTAQTPAITHDQAEALLQRDAARAQTNAIRLCAPAHLDWRWQVALGDFVFNMGAGRLMGSTLRACIRRGDFGQATLELDKWIYAGGQKARGLVIRRRMERMLVTDALPLTPEAVASTRALLLRTVRL